MTLGTRARAVLAVAILGLVVPLPTPAFAWPTPAPSSTATPTDPTAGPTTESPAAPIAPTPEPTAWTPTRTHSPAAPTGPTTTPTPRTPWRTHPPTTEPTTSAPTLTPSPTPTPSAEPSTGVWWSAATNDATAPEVPAGGLWVSSGPHHEEAVSALRFTVPAGVTPTGLVLHVHDQQSRLNPATVDACPPATAWTSPSTTPGPSADKPTADCAKQRVRGTLSADGTSVVLDLGWSAAETPSTSCWCAQWATRRLSSTPRSRSRRCVTSTAADPVAATRLPPPPRAPPRRPPPQPDSTATPTVTPRLPPPRQSPGRTSRPGAGRPLHRTSCSARVVPCSSVHCCRRLVSRPVLLRVSWLRWCFRPSSPERGRSRRLS